VQRAVQPDAESVDVEERQREHEAIVRAPAPRDPQRSALASRFACESTGAFRAGRGADV
jgi:hypothetical protein